MEIEIRELQVKDVFTVARMLGKVTKGARFELARSFTGKKVNPTELGIALFQSIFTDAEEDLKEWLADLVGKTKKIEKDGETIAVPDVRAFEAMPATAVLDIVEKLIAREDIKDFFRRASSLVSEPTKKWIAPVA